MAEIDEGSSLQPAASGSNSVRLAVAAVLSMVFGFLGGWLAINLDQSDNGTANDKIVLRESQLITEAVEKLGPSVVSISVQTTTTTSGFFGPQVFESEGAGTGIILNRHGLVVTNKHVIPAGATEVRIILSDGTEYDKVKVLGRDPFNDIAFVKIEGAKDLTPATIGDSASMRVGDKVIAVGNALGQFENTVTSGIISGTGRPIVAGDTTSSEQLQNLFQTDAAINPGNSGGPLANLNGEVIGINTAVASAAENIGFAIPINDVKPAIASVEKNGKLVRPYVGVRYVMLTKEIAKELGLETTQGAAVLAGTRGQPGVVPGSPAAKAGLKEEDVITKVNDQVVDEKHNLVTVVGQFTVGETVQLTIIRDGKEMVLPLTLEAAPARLSQ